MKIPKLPFHNVISDMLYTLIFQGECIAYVTIMVDDEAVRSFNIPVEARYAMLITESDPNQNNKDLIIRFREDGSNPSADEGMPLGDMGVYEVKGKENMSQFRMIGIEAGKQHKVRVQFFG